MNSRIRELRNSMNMTQGQFAKFIGITRKNLCQIEDNELDVSDSLIQSICEKFDVNILWFKYGIETDDNYSKERGDIFIHNIKSAIIKTIEDIDDNVMAHLIYNIKNVLLKTQYVEKNTFTDTDEVESILLSYKNELESEKKGTIFLASQNLKDTKIDINYYPG